VIDARVAGIDGAFLSEQAPSSWAQASALAELSQLAEFGVISADDARHRKDRLIMLGEVCVRLRTLVELHSNGILATDQLDTKRATLVRTLSTALVPVAP
jgi:hypothetical protein